MFQSIVQWLVDTVFVLGYPGIVILMFLESSFVPFPSEVVVIPAGYLASEKKMNFWMVVFSGILGSILGALFNYYIAVTLGRKLLKKYQKWFLLNDERFARVEAYFKDHGPISTFIGRLIPLIRQYISFPAGLSRMNLVSFVLYTALGAGIWVFILAYIGYLVGNNQELIEKYLHTSMMWLFIGVFVIAFLYIFHFRYKKKKRIQA